MYQERLKRLLNLMNQNHFEVVALNPGNSLKYLANLNFHLMERPTVLLINQTGKAALVHPELEKIKAEKCALPCRLFSYQEDPATWNQAFKGAIQYLKIKNETIGVEPNRFRFLEFNFLIENAPLAQIESGAPIFDQLRIIKDSAEIEAMQTAARIAEEGLKSTLGKFKVGVSEKELAAELIIQLFRAGSEGEMPFEPIVASGPNSANPHAIPSDRKVESGDILLFDWGAAFGGYVSDITRCFAINHIPHPFNEIGEAVLAANRVGRETGKPGIQVGEIDRITRAEINKSGFGDYFIHRTGHGLGMEAHEGPYIFAENNLILSKGMVYTIEPGIYLPGKGGIRIEDDVVVTDAGSMSLTTMPRELKVLD